MSWGNAFSQAGTYGASGYMVGGPWGAGIGAGIGLISGALQEDPEKVDVQKLLGPDLKTLRTNSAAQSKLGGELTGMGTDALAPVLSYYKSLMSGNPSALLAATAPDRGRVIDQYDGARKAMAMGPRGGGTTSAQANSQIGEANALQEILSTARDKGAAGAAQVGSQVLGAGIQTQSLATQSLGQVINAVLAGAGLDVQQNAQTQASQAAQGEAMGSLIGLLLTSDSMKGLGKGKAGGTPSLGMGSGPYSPAWSGGFP